MIDYLRILSDGSYVRVSREVPVGRKLYRVSLVDKWAGGNSWMEAVTVESGKRKRDGSVEWTIYYGEEPLEVYKARKGFQPELTTVLEWSKFLERESETP